MRRSKNPLKGFSFYVWVVSVDEWYGPYGSLPTAKAVKSGLQKNAGCFEAQIIKTETTCVALYKDLS